MDMVLHHGHTLFMAMVLHHGHTLFMAMVLHHGHTLFMAMVLHHGHTLFMAMVLRHGHTLFMAMVLRHGHTLIGVASFWCQQATHLPHEMSTTFTLSPSLFWTHYFTYGVSCLSLLALICVRYSERRRLTPLWVVYCGILDLVWICVHLLSMVVMTAATSNGVEIDVEDWNEYQTETTGIAVVWFVVSTLTCVLGCCLLTPSCAPSLHRDRIYTTYLMCSAVNVLYHLVALGALVRLAQLSLAWQQRTLVITAMYGGLMVYRGVECFYRARLHVSNEPLMIEMQDSRRNVSTV